MKNARCAFIAAGGNKHPGAADVDEHTGLVAFGADRNVALWNPRNGDAKSGIQTLLFGHTDVVNVVKFFRPRHSHLSFLLSGSADATIRLWRRCSDSQSASSSPDESQNFACCRTIEEHSKSINAVAVLSERGIFVTGAADSQLKIWTCDLNNDAVDVNLVQSISLSPKYFPLCLALSVLPQSSAIVLAAAGSKTFVQLYLSNSEGCTFELSATLTGHEGWVRSLDFCRDLQSPHSPSDDLLLASASQDKYIRLWRFHIGESLSKAVKDTEDPLLDVRKISLSNKAHLLEVAGTNYSVTFEALLLGHEDWIWNARWDERSGSLRLLSASADNSLAIWQPDEASGVWTCTVRLGEISAQKGATTATGTTGGYWIGLWHDNGQSVLSLSKTGSWRCWVHHVNGDTWTQTPAVSGHTREVVDLAWAKNSSYLLSTSSDQTTRMFAPVKVGSITSWHELSRPQIHGYDLNCIDTITNTRFISGADEKLLRVFDEPKAVADLLLAVCGIEPPTAYAMPEAANIPVLGLSNKTVDSNEPEGGEANGEADSFVLQEAEDPRSRDSQTLKDARAPPLEDHLARHLLWPEIEKLYGHGYEICAVAASNDGQVVATACRASSTDHAVVRLYRTSDWREVKPSLEAHSLTVTRLQFSPDDALLLSVGRDRQCAVFVRNDTDAAVYTWAAADPKAHTRMLLDASWAPVAAGRVFATAGRDRAVHIWRFNDGDLSKQASLTASAPVSAVAFLPYVCAGRLVIACGLDDGTVFLRTVASDTLEVNEHQIDFERRLLPSRGVTRLIWRPRSGEVGSAALLEAQLAISSEDSSVRIIDVDIAEILEDA